jgi:hypothetical protein
LTSYGVVACWEPITITVSSLTQPSSSDFFRPHHTYIGTPLVLHPTSHHMASTLHPGPQWGHPQPVWAALLSCCHIQDLPYPAFMPSSCRGQLLGFPPGAGLLEDSICNMYEGYVPGRLTHCSMTSSTTLVHKLG